MNSAPPLPPSSGRSRFEIHRLHVAIVVFPDVEELDVAGLFGVFAAVNDVGVDPGLHVFTVADTPSGIHAAHGLRLVPDFTFERCPRPDVLVLPGGPGTRLLLGKPSLLEWIRTRSHTAQATLGADAGAHLLAKAGLLDGLTATARADRQAELAELAPLAKIDPSQGFHDNPHPTGPGRLVISAGVSAGFDAALHIVGALLGAEVEDRVRRHLAYTRPPDDLRP